MRLGKKPAEASCSSVAQGAMEVQKMKIEEAFLSWKGTLGQVDDVLVAGVEIRE